MWEKIEGLITITKGAKIRKCTLVAGLKGFTAALFMEEQEQTFITKSVK